VDAVKGDIRVFCAEDDEVEAWARRTGSHVARYELAAEKSLIRSRAVDLQADPSVGLTWDGLKARVAARRA
jgi:hypothetical protein